MKFNKDIIFAVIICVIILVGWEPFCRYMGWMPSNEPTRSVQPQPKITTAPQSTTIQPAAVAPAPVQTVAKTVDDAIKNLPQITIANSVLSVDISQAEGAITSVTLLKYKNHDRSSDVKIDQTGRGEPFGALAINDPAAKWTTIEVISREERPNGFTLTRMVTTPAGGKMRIAQSWDLVPDSYAIKYSASITNAAETDLSLAPVVFGGYLAPWALDSGDRAERSIVHRLSFMNGQGDYDDVNADAKDTKFFAFDGTPSDWSSVSNKYFCTILDANLPFLLYQNRVMKNISGVEKSVPMITTGAKIQPFVLHPSEKQRFEFDFYCGPKILHNLEEFNPSAGKIVHLSWGPLDYLARFLLWCLAKLHELTGNYGISIIILTLIVRTIFYPVSAKANASMKKMQVVQPQLKELKEKYKDNPQLMNTKMMELYRKEGINPLGGCLPMLFQIPVFIALYHALYGAVQLRQASFLWAKDLAQPDTIATLNLYFFQLPINPLVLVMTLLMIIQQRITPMSADPMQKKMMLMMPIVMLIFLYDLPSGLTLYWTVSNCFSIVQLKLQHKNNSASTAVAQK